eukprot:CAMPEP_0173414460 /NCGR_PEP_ID=MMETSP1356-20130122/84339_1 /TAXON_ID=77927 ORGANISM="Hemiselmis virescens, Strain PCC157" /NCGR_SAMPLE_ID=MMETSP1356 /ASSEMBLY_ACC=CAM_ASM_000847 /LENGTH=512 /DNA_ID=CAMNT_0014376643 /DNA_START=10 /DNA_END=1548 /DNA_ORIENTATION=+
MESKRVGAVIAAVAAVCLCVAVVRHGSMPRSELLQGSDFSAERRAALQELSASHATPMLASAEKAAYAQGYKQGETEELRETQAPALLRAANKWKTTMLARLRAQEQEEKTLDARKEVRAEQKVASAMTAAMQAEEREEPKAYKEWQSMGAGNQEDFAAKRISLAMAAANKKEPAAYRRMQLAMREEEKAEPKAYEAWHSMGGGNQEAEAAKKMSLAYRAEETYEPAAYEHFEDAHAERARRAKAWHSMGGGNQEAEAAKKMSLAYRAEETYEPAAYEHFEDAHAERARRAMAESRLEKMHQEMQHRATEFALAEQEKHALDEASRLYSFCAKEFPAAEGLRKFCFEKLSSPPEHADLMAPREAAPHASMMEQQPLVGGAQHQQQVQFTGPSLQAAIERAHAAGLGGMPKYAVYHGADGEEETFRLEQVPRGGKVPKGAVGFVNMPDVPRSQLSEHRVRELTHPSPVKVDAPTLAGAIREAHKMGLKGEPQYVVFHPAHGAPEVFQLAGREQ